MPAGEVGCKWLYRDKGILIGRAFRWTPEHTQELEDHLHSGQALPVGPGRAGRLSGAARGGPEKSSGRWCCRGASWSATC